MKREVRTFKNQISREILAKANAAEWKSADQGVHIAMDASSGPRTTKYLSQFKPGAYARARQSPLFDPEIINVQTGVFRASWRTFKADQSNNPVIGNIDPKAKYLEQAAFNGTALWSPMVQRPIDKLIRRLLMPVRLRNLREAFKS